jgi:hypothetical protein
MKDEDIRKLKEELKKYWVAYCEKCDWLGLTKDCDGGGQIADTGDYFAPLCPICGEVIEEADNDIIYIKLIEARKTIQSQR